MRNHKVVRMGSCSGSVGCHADDLDLFLKLMGILEIIVFTRKHLSLALHWLMRVSWA